MGKLRQFLLTLFVAAALATCAAAQGNLTQIRDTINNPNGTPFSGTVVITWVGFSTPTSGSVSPLSTSARIYNGALSVLLVPSTTAGAGSYYQVVYYSNDGTVTWTETWAVPPSTNALSVSSVRTSTTTGGGTSTGTGSGTGSTGGGSGPGSQYATLPITISEITGLSGDLTSINSTLTSLQTTVNGLSPSSGGGSSAAITALTNTVNSLSNTVTGLSTSSATNSANITSLTTTVGGISSTVNTLGNSVTTLATAIGSLQSTSGGTINAAFVDGETPSGTLDGTNVAFALSQNPAPAASLELYRNGLVQTVGLDYTISGTQLTFLSGNVPVSGDILQAYYRVAGTSPVTLFSDDETPTGSVNGTNVTFVLAHAPNPAIGLKLYKNGMLLQQHADYNITGATITFSSASAPQTGDAIVAYYRR